MTMPVTDHEGAVYVPVAPAPAAPAAGPAPPRTSGDGVVRRRTTRRRPIPRGTVALGATAAGGLAITMAGVLLPPVAAAVAAGALVVVPASVAMRRARRARRGAGHGRRRSAYGAGGRRGGLFGGRRGDRGGGGRIGNPFKGLGGGGRHSGGTPSTARSGGLPSAKDRGTRGGKKLGLPKLGTRTGRTPGAGRGAGGRVPGTGAGQRGGGRGTGGVPTARGRGSTGTSGGPRSGRRLGLGRRGTGSRGRRPRTSTGRALRGLGIAGAAPFVGGYRIGRAGARGVGNTGRAIGAGVRAGGRPRDAMKAAWQRTGQGRPRTFRGRLGRLMVGTLGACTALAVRGTVNGTRRAYRKIRAAYAPQPAGQQAPTQPPIRPTNQGPEHPVPPPQRRPPAPSTNPSPAPAGTGSGGTRTVSSHFPPRDAAVDFYAAAVKYTPGTHSGALWNLQWALPQMAEASWLVAHGWRAMANRIQADLRGGLKPEMLTVMTDIYRLYAKAAQLAQGLPADFVKIHAEDIRRAQTQGSHTANVPAGR